MPHAPVRVLIASRSPAWSAGIESWLVPPLARVEVALGAADALGALAAGGHRLAVIDRELDDRPGADLAREIRARHPEMPILLVVDDDPAADGHSPRRFGAETHLAPTCTRDGLLTALEDGILAPLAARARRDTAVDALLTEQERVVLALMRRPLTYKEIAQGLGVSWHTVRTHAQSILRKRGVHSRRDLDPLDVRIGDVAAPRNREGAAA